MNAKSETVIIAVLALGMLGTTTLSSQAFAATGNCSFSDKAHATTCWCYSSNGGASITCFQSKGDCNKAQRSAFLPTSGCYKIDAAP